MLILALASLACSLLSLGCYIIVLIHAFNTSTTEGFLSLCVPCYSLYYMFTKFEHENKGMIMAGAIGGGALANVLSMMAQGGGGY